MSDEKHKICILDDDERSAAFLKDFLPARGIEGVEIVDSREDMTLEGGARALCVGAVPAGLSLKEADIFKRPLRLGALVDRVYGLQKKLSRGIQDRVHIAGYELDRVLSVLRKGDDEISLTDKERDILLILHKRSGAAIDRETLLSDVWGHRADLETHTVETHIYRLRQKIEADPAKPVILVTDGEGYRLVDLKG